MIPKDLQHDLTLTLLRASLKGKYSMSSVAETHDITLMQALTLCLLEPHQGARMSTISSHLSCDPSSVTGIVERLVSLRFIERKESETDRRSKVISLTENGLLLREELLQVMSENRFPQLQSLSIDEVHEFMRLINKAAGGTSLPVTN